MHNAQIEISILFISIILRTLEPSVPTCYLLSVIYLRRVEEPLEPPERPPLLLPPLKPPDERVEDEDGR